MDEADTGELDDLESRSNPDVGFIGCPRVTSCTTLLIGFYRTQQPSFGKLASAFEDIAQYK
ncbi:hypothetical protein GCM10009096_16130 [Parasphingorhabdus litoris]|uniref:Uncharacterized protein n=1 Tax=Parasphingorhabdus litoris TaxID=394733 RepID=A0ABP3KAT9_9SPHN